MNRSSLSHLLGFVLIFSNLALVLRAEAEEATSKSIDLFETVSVIGTHLPGDTAAGSYDVIDADTIEARHSQSVSELLRHVSGVDVSKPGGAGAAEVFLRGA